jgi:hypothetical protein
MFVFIDRYDSLMCVTVLMRDSGSWGELGNISHKLLMDGQSSIEG